MTALTIRIREIHSASSDEPKIVVAYTRRKLFSLSWETLRLCRLSPDGQLCSGRCVRGRWVQVLAAAAPKPASSSAASFREQDGGEPRRRRKGRSYLPPVSRSSWNPSPNILIMSFCSKHGHSSPGRWGCLTVVQGACPPTSLLLCEEATERGRAKQQPRRYSRDLSAA